MKRSTSSFIDAMIRLCEAGQKDRAAYRSGVKKLLNLGSSCIYPRLAPQPLKEEYLLSGKLEPTNLYGPNDKFDLETSHAFPALLRKTHEAKERGTRLIVWDDGTPRREFLYVDDLSDAVIHLVERCGYRELGEFINIGTGQEITILELAELIASVVGYKEELEWDTSKPKSIPRKLLDISRIRSLGWKPKTPLREGIAKTYGWFLEHVAKY